MKNRKKVNSILIWAIVILAVVIIDLVVKHFIVGIDKEVIDGFFRFTYAENTGAAWSMFSGSRWALIVISIFAVLLLSFYTIASKSASKFFHISVGLILGGAIGNLFDRLVFGYVRDFIQLEFVEFPIFNIADMALTIGVACLIVYYIVEMIKELKKEKQNKINK